MTCEDISPIASTPVGGGVATAIVTAGYDWVAVLINVSGAAASFQVLVNTDTGSGFVVAANAALPAGNSVCVAFGGHGGGRADNGNNVNNHFFSFVPNQIQIVLSGTAGATWNWAVIGGYNE